METVIYEIGLLNFGSKRVDQVLLNSYEIVCLQKQLGSTVLTHPNMRESASRNGLGKLSAAANDALQERMKS